MPYRPFDGQNCSIAETLAVVGERWTLLLLREVLLGRWRFEEIRRETGIAPNILADRLDTLVDHRVLERRLYSKRPEAHEYVPTQRALDLYPALVALQRWGDEHVKDDPPRVIIHAACGHETKPQMTCPECGERIDPRDLRLRPGPGAVGEQREEGVLPPPGRVP